MWDMMRYSTLFRPIVVLFDLIITGVIRLLKYSSNIDESFPIYVCHSLDRRELHFWKIKVWYPLLRKDVCYRDDIRSDVPVDIVIPTIDKDYMTLDGVIVSARKYVKHPIHNIYIVSNNKASELVKYCKDYNCKFIDEDSVLGYRKDQIKYCINGHNRSGWLFQQLLKLSCDTYVDCENTLILDSDTVFLRPKIFIYNDKTVFDQSDELHEPYFAVMNKLLNTTICPVASFIVHYMLFNKQVLKELKSTIEYNHGMTWDDAIIKYTDYTSNSGFSEYETYANYFFLKHRSNMILNYWYNCTNYSEYKPYLKSYSQHNYKIDTSV